jgi:hypothetical protein
MDFKEREWKNVHWVHLVYVRDQWWTLLKILMNLQVSIKCVGFFN